MTKRITITFDTKLKRTDRELEKVKGILNKLKECEMGTGTVTIRGFKISIEDVMNSMGF